jgi:hypothetical protein
MKIKSHQEWFSGNEFTLATIPSRIVAIDRNQTNNPMCFEISITFIT